MAGNSSAEDVSAALRQYRVDLQKEGWRVETIAVGRDSDNAANATDAGPVKTAIQTASSARGPFAGIVLIGHVPVPLAGLGAHSDGHANATPPNTDSSEGAWPADLYYGDLGANAAARWTDDGTMNDYDMVNANLGVYGTGAELFIGDLNGNGSVDGDDVQLIERLLGVTVLF